MSTVTLAPSLPATTTAPSRRTGKSTATGRAGMTTPSVLFFFALLSSTPPITAPAIRRTTTAVTMILVRSGPRLLRADATVLLPDDVLACWRFRRALRSAPPTDLPFLTFAEQPVE